MKKIVFLLFLILSLITVENGFAFTLTLNNATVKEKVTPGDVVAGSITVKNSTDQRVAVKAYFEDFLYVEPYDGSKEFYPAGSLENSCSNWITFSPQDFELAAFEQKKVDYTIRVPSNAKNGNYGVFFFETALGALKKENQNVLVSGRIGSLFFVEVENSLKKASVTNFSGGKNKITSDYKNIGKVFTHCKPSFFVMDNQGMVIDRGQMNEIYMFPDSSTSVEISLSDKISPGSYTAVCTFDLQDGDVIVREVDFRKDLSGNIIVISVRE